MEKGHTSPKFYIIKVNLSLQVKLKKLSSYDKLGRVQKP
jgi:hypothetical protein